MPRRKQKQTKTRTKKVGGSIYDLATMMVAKNGGKLVGFDPAILKQQYWLNSLTGEKGIALL